QTVVRAVSWRRNRKLVPGEQQEAAREPKTQQSNKGSSFAGADGGCLATPRFRPFVAPCESGFGEGDMRQTWFEQYQERQAATRSKQRDSLTAEQSARYAQEARGEMRDLIQVRRRERQREAENSGFLEVLENEAMADQDIKWPPGSDRQDRKSTRLNSSHSQISYAVFCLKKKTCAMSRHRCA